MGVGEGRRTPDIRSVPSRERSRPWRPGARCPPSQRSPCAGRPDSRRKASDTATRVRLEALELSSGFIWLCRVKSLQKMKIMLNSPLATPLGMQKSISN